MTYSRRNRTMASELIKTATSCSLRPMRSTSYERIRTLYNETTRTLLSLGYKNMVLLSLSEVEENSPTRRNRSESLTQLWRKRTE